MHVQTATLLLTYILFLLSHKFENAKKRKTAPQSPPKGTAKRKNPPEVPTAAAKKAAVELKDAPISVVPAKSTTPSPDTKSPARSSQMSGAAHPVTSVVVPTARTPNNDNTQGELTMEGGIAAMD
jgi:hypothetical protein